MSKRLIIKTVLICIGLFLIMDSALFAYIFTKYPLNMEKQVSVVVATADIKKGTVIEERFLRKKDVWESTVNSSIERDIGNIEGKKALTDIYKDDYIRSCDLLEKKDWYKDDERIIVLPTNMEERLANLIRKGSYVDIRLQKDSGEATEDILYKIKVEDVLDETGTALDSKSAVNSKTAYFKLVLGKKERQKIYSAAKNGRLIYELYCDNIQKSGEEFK
ncbi:SAF domain-containing protein [Ruminiclostridium cellulolyticum]|uniref:SAF domain protein n=1 Tax=Ruminiclostridium cellulolyticum (strain ATCC 35319 / DSM 5812 / JCM 6584 / H10) TaxID=394503 RepID=B8I4E6_RUMCH|nr:SAF domain-containing protein [Ruminiclostridium cellulolyticum]ACL74500.1 SAF domain protein [Ruminiclostridium cellulolyticum H10]